MNLLRIRAEIQAAREHFPNIESFSTPDGAVYVKAAFQTSVGRVYVIKVTFAGYPSTMPRVSVIAPAIQHCMHMYQGDFLCYMHPHFWNPALHDLRYVLAQIAVWLNKHEVYVATNSWPGPSHDHRA